MAHSTYACSRLSPRAASAISPDVELVGQIALLYAFIGYGRWPSTHEAAEIVLLISGV